MNTLLNDHPWIGVDLDATLAHYDDWHGIDHIGPPIKAMQTRVKQWLSEGKPVRILTARVGPQHHDVPHTIEEITHHIEQWCLKHLGQILPVTCQKDYNMVAFYDDRCMQVIPNEGTCVVDDFNQRLIDRTTGFMQTLGQQALEIASLKQERDEFRKIVFDSHREAHDLAIAMHRNYYMETAPHWEPLPEVPGLISQIDNMYAGVRGKHEEALHALRQAYVHNQNMHCFVTQGRLNDQLNEQTHVLRKALGIPETTAPLPQP